MTGGALEPVDLARPHAPGLRMLLKEEGGGGGGCDRTIAQRPGVVAGRASPRRTALWPRPPHRVDRAAHRADRVRAARRARRTSTVVRRRSRHGRAAQPQERAR